MKLLASTTVALCLAGVFVAIEAEDFPFSPLPGWDIRESEQRDIDDYRDLLRAMPGLHNEYEDNFEWEDSRGYGRVINGVFVIERPANHQWWRVLDRKASGRDDLVVRENRDTLRPGYERYIAVEQGVMPCERNTDDVKQNENDSIRRRFDIWADASVRRLAYQNSAKILCWSQFAESGRDQNSAKIVRDGQHWQAVERLSKTGSTRMLSDRGQHPARTFQFIQAPEPLPPTPAPVPAIEEHEVDIGGYIAFEAPVSAHWSTVPHDWGGQVLAGGLAYATGTGTSKRDITVFCAYVADGELTVRQYVVHVVGAAPGPGPAPPDPSPGPGPSPPEPSAPIDVDGLTVLIVYESGDLSRMPPAQQLVLYSAKVRDWLNANCTSDPSGNKAWRIYDADVDTSNAGQTWQDAMARPRGSLPWVLIANEREGYEGPLPGTVEEFIELAGRYAK